MLGICFEELQEELKRVYAIYCRNHDGVITLLEKVIIYLFYIFYGCFVCFCGLE